MCPLRCWIGRAYIEGQMIANATPIFNTAWWYMIFPGTALLLTVLAFNLLGDGLRDALNPRNAR